MPPKGKSKDGAVGRALLRRHQGYGPRGMGALAPQSDKTEQKELVSLLEVSSLDEFLNTALMAQRDFTAIKERDLVLIDTSAPVARKPLPLTSTFKQLHVPRRPAWHPGMSAAELDRAEKDAFLAWRREIASLEEATADRIKVTPFEKNLEVWRQLWRVVERSHVVVQIVDARDPLFYYSEDLHDYAGGLTPPRARLILVNKADYLSARQRSMWARHFRGKGWNYAFFSARDAQLRLTEQARKDKILAERGVEPATDEQQDSSEDEAEGREQSGIGEQPDGGAQAGDAVRADVVDDGAEHGEMHVDAAVGQDGEKDEHGTVADGDEQDAVEDEGLEVLDDVSADVLTREQLIARLRSVAVEAAPEAAQACVGMVGFPNVGKSSVINVLMGVTALDHGKSRVAVSATPGKTKHFQTLPLDSGTMLCDCPGLVFPSFVATTADMVCAGVLPINQLRDHVAPMDVVCRRVPAHLLRGHYGLAALSEPQMGREFLIDLCERRGFWSQGSGVPDINRAARMVLKDYVEGRSLFFCHAPPGLTGEDSSMFADETTESLRRASARIDKRLRETELDEADEDRERGIGGANHEPDDGESSDGEAGVSESAVSEGVTVSSAAGERSGKARVRPQKKWGKKGKKFMNKNPYGEAPEDVLGEAGPRPASAGAGARVMGRKMGGSMFTRVTMPYPSGNGQA